MNNHSKRLMKHLEALGFRRDHDAQTRGIAYRHANQPGQVLKVFDKMTDNTITAVSKAAEKIVGTGSSGTSSSPTIRERARVQKRSAKAQRDAELKATNERGAKAEADYQRRQQIIAADAARREISDLMQPKHGR